MAEEAEEAEKTFQIKAAIEDTFRSIEKTSFIKLTAKSQINQCVYSVYRVLSLSPSVCDCFYFPVRCTTKFFGCFCWRIHTNEWNTSTLVSTVQYVVSFQTRYTLFFITKWSWYMLKIHPKKDCTERLKKKKLSQSRNDINYRLFHFSIAKSIQITFRTIDRWVNCKSTWIEITLREQ